MGAEGKQQLNEALWLSSFFLWCGVRGAAGTFAKKKQPQNLQTYQQSEVSEEK